MKRRVRLPHRNRATGLEPQTVRALGKASGIERDHRAAAVACRKVERVRKVQALAHLCKSRLDQIAVLDRDHFRAFFARTRETSMFSTDTGAPLYLSMPKPSSRRAGAPVRTGTIPSVLRTFLEITACPFQDPVVVIAPSLCPCPACGTIVAQSPYRGKPPDDHRTGSASCWSLLRFRGRERDRVRTDEVVW